MCSNHIHFPVMDRLKNLSHFLYILASIMSPSLLAMALIIDVATNLIDDKIQYKTNIRIIN